jgi:hypothetical protein
MGISNEFKYFLKKFLKIVVMFGIIFYINIGISNNCLNIKSYYYNRSILYFLLLYLCIFISDIFTSDSDYVNKFVYALLACILLIYFVNYLIYNYMYKGFWLSLLISFGFSILIFGIFAISFWYSIESKEKNRPLFLQFNYADFNNNTMTNFILYFFILYGFLFWLTNTNSKIGIYLNQNITGLLAMILVIYIIFSYAIKIKLIDSKQILNTVFTYFCVLYVIGIIQTYFIIDSVHNTCYGLEPTNENKEKGVKAEIFGNLLLVSIVIILILNDIRKWSFMNYLSYLLVTLYIIYCLVTLSSSYPSISMLSFWGFIEWCILTSYNNHDTFNSFSFVMMNHKYNLKSKNLEGT